jgi:hypothetical protein
MNRFLRQTTVYNMQTRYVLCLVRKKIRSVSMNEVMK